MKCVQWWYFLVHDWLKLYQSDYQKLSMYAEVRCVVLFEAEIHFGGARWPVSHGEPASLVQSVSC